jgi:hypothetical protein
MKKKETLLDILLKVSELRMDVETAEKRILRLFDVSESKIIIGRKYLVEEYETKVVVIGKDDDKKQALVTPDLVDNTGRFWIKYHKLK